MTAKDPDADLRELAIRVNGFLYHGDRLEAVIETVKVLRADPSLALRLVFPDGQHSLEWGVHSPRYYTDGWCIDWREHLVWEDARKAEPNLQVLVRDVVEWPVDAPRRTWARFVGP